MSSGDKRGGVRWSFLNLPLLTTSTVKLLASVYSQKERQFSLLVDLCGKEQI